MRVNLTLAIILSCLILTFANDEDFAFDNFEESDAHLQNFGANWDAPYQRFLAHSGRIFHLVVPKTIFDKDTTKFEAKLNNGKSLPQWLIFDKTDAVFWGVPLDSDLGSIDVTIRNFNSEKRTFKNIVIDVQPSSVTYTSSKKCSSSEDITLLSLLIDKWIESIKPKQRVVALSDISKFFSIPLSAFTLKPLREQDDLSDNSVILAGPGNVKKRSSNSTSILEVPVGCDGRIIPQYTSLIHQLKHQAKDGTISEVIGLPLIGWRVKVHRLTTNRRRRQALEEIPDGSGEYDGDYYDDYEGSEDYDETEEEIPKTTTVSTTSVSPPKTTEKISQTTVHPHRHHHGEAKNDVMPDWTIVDDNSLGNGNMIPLTSPEVPKPPPTTRGSTTAAKITTSTEKSTTMKLEFPKNIDTYVDEYGNYNTDDYEDDNDDDVDDIGDVETQTIVPVPKTTPTTSSTTTTTTSKPITTTAEQIIIEEDPVFEETTTEKYRTEKTSERTNSETIYSTTMKTTIPTVITTEIETKIPTTTMIMTTTPSTTTSTTAITTTTAAATTTTSTTTTEASTSTSTTTPSTTTPATTTTARTTTSPTITTTTTTLAPTTEILEESEETTPTKLTTLRHIPSTSPPFTTYPEEENKNEAPYIENRLKRKNVVAGKIFRFVIPEDTFRDSEDNYDLTLEFLDSDEKPITADSWCQFNPLRREIYGLPLDDHVSKWEYIIRATDKDGASVQDRLTILVQQHKLQRVFNLEFSLEIRIEKKEEFKHYVDWSLKTLRALGRLYNTNMSEITVRKLSFDKQPIIFTWSNDSLPTNYCPKNEIEKLFKILTANDRGDPSRELNNAVTPELRVKKVSYSGLGVCEELNTPITPQANFPPVLRNPVNRINATVGQMLVFRVPKDTFYDPEDVDPLSLNFTLLTGNRQTIPPHNWLQFDSKNREFFGIPRKASRSEYQLICVDSGGLPGIDSLEVVVYPAPKIHFNVEFSMTIETAYDTFVENPMIQRKFVDKLVEIFEDDNASHIQFLPFKQKQNSVIVTWYNRTLPTDKCPHDEIAKLESIMKNEERGISNRVHSIMEPDFQVSTIKVLPISSCNLHKKKYHYTPKMPDERITVDESSQTTSSSDDYLLTFIVPVVVISIMTFFAILAACVLYRRRRTGKMNVLEDGRQSYGNKGIPVIFQEELDEKPEAGTKAPIILKDEKPPLAPPEYSKSGSLKFNDDSEPYHPPPPFTRTQENNKQSRPKPAPTYRKPPPYVPP